MSNLLHKPTGDRQPGSACHLGRRLNTAAILSLVWVLSSLSSFAALSSVWALSALSALSTLSVLSACNHSRPRELGKDEVFVDIRLPTCRVQDPARQTRPAILNHSERMEPADRPNWIVVTADPLLPIARQWAEYRRSTGSTSRVISVSELLAGRSLVADQFLAALRERLLRELGTSHPTGLVHLLLLGDSRDTDLHPEVRPDLVPTLSWHSEYLTDMPFADLDADGLPDLALGRIPVRDPVQAEALLQKTMAYEQGTVPGPWRHRLLLFASQGGFGPLVDALMERAGLDLLSSLPEQWDITFLHARPGSAYGLPPHTYTKTLLTLLSRGELLAVYTGHGYLDALEDVDWGPKKRASILDIPDLDHISCDTHCPIVVLAACHTGDFGHGTSFAEAMLRTENGPPAVGAATDVSHPFPNAMLAFKLVRLISKREVSTIGHAFLEALLNLGQPETLAEMRVDRLVTLLWSQEDLRDIFDENRRMYVLLADPALRLPLSESTLRMGYRFIGKRRILVCGRLDHIRSGLVQLSLLRPRLLLPADLDTSRIPSTPEAALARWRRANKRTLLKKEGVVENGAFSFTLTLPAWHEPGRMVLRALVVGASDDAAAAIAVDTAAPNEPRP